MKKILLFIIALTFIVGCNNLMNTPTKKTEEFLNKYQKLDSKVLDQLDGTLDTSYDLNESQKEKYKDAIKRQYKDLVYTIKEETVDGDTATVKVEIEVYDYRKVLDDADSYFKAHPDEFQKSDGSVDNEKFMDYKIGKLKSGKDRVKYTLNLTLTKKDDVWTMNDITETDRKKIHGIYSY